MYCISLLAYLSERGLTYLSFAMLCSFLLSAAAVRNGAPTPLRNIINGFLYLFYDLIQYNNIFFNFNTLMGKSMPVIRKKARYPP